jgi:hypothetical protein
MRHDYYIDTEFIEGSQKKRFLGIPVGNTKPTIELISIGIVSKNGDKEFYTICNEFNLREAWNRFDLKNVPGSRHQEKVYWIRENVLRPVFDEFVQIDLKQDWSLQAKHHRFNYRNMKSLLDLYGKSREFIAKEIYEFVGADSFGDSDTVRFIGYYSDYDWVVFCWLFGKMIDLPKKFPMYCYDLQQKFADKLNSIVVMPDEDQVNNTELTYSQKVLYFTSRANYPKQANEHSAIWDARWNRALDSFIDNHIK